MLMRLLYRRLKGFWRAIMVFVAAVEAPIILLFSSICMPAASYVLGIPPAGQSSFITASAAWMGLFHMQAAVTNLLIEVFEHTKHLNKK